MSENTNSSNVVPNVLGQPSLISTTNNPLLVRGVPNLGGANKISVTEPLINIGPPSFLSDTNNPLLLRGASNLGGIGNKTSGEIGGLPYKDLNINNNNNRADAPPLYTPLSHSSIADHNMDQNAMTYNSNHAYVPQISFERPLTEPYQFSEKADHQNVWNWIQKSGTTIFNKVIEKTKDSVDTVITTFDPQMKDYINSTSKIYIYTDTLCEITLKVMKESFQSTLGRIHLEKNETDSNQTSQNMAPQLVGFSIALHSCEQKAEKLKNKIIPNIPMVKGANETDNIKILILAIESFIVEITPSRWYHSYCMLLSDITECTQASPNAISEPIQLYSEAIPLPKELVDYMLTQTPPDYPYRWSGLLTTLEQALEIFRYGSASTQHNVPSTLDWSTLIVGRSTKDLMSNSLTNLAEMYKVKYKPTT